MGANEPLWTIHELVSLSARALADESVAQANGQVRELPDLRTLRFYTTLGLLDRPAAMRGRTALYGRRHLLQVVAIKRLQAQGLSLVEIQERLLGLPTRDLARLACVPAAVLEAPTSASGMPAPPRRAAAFWKALPAPAPALPAPRTLSPVAVELAPSVILLLAAAGRLSEPDSRAVREAARPLLETLNRLGLHPCKEAQ